MTAPRRRLWRARMGPPRPTASPFATDPIPQSRPPIRRWRPQFGMLAALATMGLFSVIFALLGGLLREGANPSKNPRMVLFVMACVASPLLVMIGVSLYQPARKLWRRFRGG